MGKREYSTGESSAVNMRGYVNALSIDQVDFLEQQESSSEIFDLLSEMQNSFFSARVVLRKSGLGAASVFFDRLHHYANDLREMAIQEGHMLANFILQSLQRVLESMVDPARATFFAISGHLDLLYQVFSEGIRTKDDARSGDVIEFLEILRILSFEEASLSRSVPYLRGT